MEEGKELVAGMTLQHFTAISSILHFYQRHLWNFTAPSVKRTRQLVEIQLLLVKMPLLVTSKIGVFTPSEISYMESAISVFVAQAKAKIPQSENRDKVIKSCEELRGYLVNNLIPPEQKYLGEGD